MVVNLESPACASCGKRRPKNLQPWMEWKRIGFADEFGGIVTVLTCNNLCTDIMRTRFAKAKS